MIYKPNKEEEESHKKETKHFEIINELDSLEKIFNILNALPKSQSLNLFLDIANLINKSVEKIATIISENPNCLNFEPNLKEGLLLLLSETRFVPSYKNGKILAGQKCNEMANKFNEFMIKIQNKASEGIKFG